MVTGAVAGCRAMAGQSASRQTTWASCAGRCARRVDRVSSTDAPASASMNDALDAAGFVIVSNDARAGSRLQAIRT